ncbi:MAG: response regulator [Chloroflexota bacterium]
MRTVLIVDDEPDVRLAMAATLEEAGIEAIVADDGDTGCQAAIEKQPSAIILDINMPRVDGFEALRSLKNDARTTDIPVILITAGFSPGMWEFGQALGAADAITKPWSDGELLRHLEQAMNSTSRC